MNRPFTSGFVAVIGRPNVGKSTLVNQIVRAKVSITSDRPQTTRSNIKAIVTDEHSQLIFVDTPGIHKPRHALGHALNAAARTSASDVDITLFLVDAAAGVGRGDQRISQELGRMSAPILGVVNKVDATEHAQSAIDRLEAFGVCDEIFAVSARTGFGVAPLLQRVTDAMPEGPMWYPTETQVDQRIETRIADLVREKLLRVAREELPHSIAVVTEEIRRSDEDQLVVDVIIFVERDSQKAIVIGKKGANLRSVGIEARPQIEEILGEHIYLSLRVKVRSDWQRSDDLVERFGYGL